MAAGLGFKTFTTGEVLTAADTNGYLMQGILVFATEVARNSAITSPQEGQFAFTKDTNSTWFYDGAAWVASGASGDVTGVTAGNGISVTSPTGPVPTVAIDTAVTVDKTTAQTLTNKTLTSPALTTPTISTLTTNGDLLYGTGSGALTRLGIGSSSQVLTVTGGVPVWATPAGGSTFVGALVYRTTNLSLSNASGVIVGWDAESFDTNGFHDNATNNSRLTVPSGKAGKYLVTCVACYNANATGFRSTSFRKNGSTYLNDWTTAPTVSTAYASTITTITLDLAVADYIDVDAYQNSGGALDLRAENFRSYFSMIYLGA